MRLITVASYDRPVDARLAVSVLEDGGIPAVIADETFSMLYGSSSFTGGIKVQVREEDGEAASSLLAESGPAALAAADDGNDTGAETRPECGPDSMAPSEGRNQ
ncbi:MAG: DUF2007 domain-containing protein [Planctomycetes bacterium]|nr:DUF2007 domain-containing protein [Planctomycetota bacterium]